MVNSFGPRPEQLAPAQRVEPDSFQRAVGSIADGGLVFPAPFDVVTAALLAANETDEQDAVDVYDAAHQVTSVRYHVQITQVVADTSNLRREVVDAVVDLDHLSPLLRDLIRNLTTPD